MINKIVKKINEYSLINDNSTIYVGVSGGADSICLLHILNTIKVNNLILENFEVIAVHINHMLRADDALLDEEYVKMFCLKHNIECIIYREDISSLSKKNKKSIEETARDFRKEKFNDLLKDGDRYALAHNLSDNAETMLMHLFRGSGLKGLTGMWYLDKNTIRPLIEVSRLDIEKYLAENDISFQTDKTNFQTIYQRNKIRLELIPYVKENFNNNIITSLNNSINSLREDNDFLEQVTNDYFYDLSEIKYQNRQKFLALNVNKLKKLHKSILVRVLQKAFLEINGACVDLSYKNISDLISLINKENGKSITLNKNIMAVKGYYDIFIINRNNFDFISHVCYDILVNEPCFIEELGCFILISDDEYSQKMGECLKNVHLIASKTFYFDEIKSFSVRNKKDADKIYLDKIKGHKSIKNYFSENKIDTIFRQNILFLTHDENILMILDKNMISNDNFNSGKYRLNFKMYK